jgi:hypothetical protein
LVTDILANFDIFLIVSLLIDIRLNGKCG